MLFTPLLVNPISLSLENVFIYLFNLLVVLRLSIKISANTISFLMETATNPCRQHVLYGLLTNLQLPRHTFLSVFITADIRVIYNYNGDNATMNNAFSLVVESRTLVNRLVSPLNLQYGVMNSMHLFLWS